MPQLDVNGVRLYYEEAGSGAPLVFVHEYGHYIVGRWCGVKADTFSIGFGRRILDDVVQPGDVVVITELEHHSNFVPWQYIAKKTFREFTKDQCPDLAAALTHSNAWHRETANRLIFERQDAGAVGPLRALLQDAEAYARAHQAYAANRSLPRPKSDVVLASLTPVLVGMTVMAIGGFNGSDPLGPEEPGHIGLATMRERAELAGGKLEIVVHSGAALFKMQRPPKKKPVRTDHFVIDDATLVFMPSAFTPTISIWRMIAACCLSMVTTATRTLLPSSRYTRASLPPFQTAT